MSILEWRPVAKADAGALSVFECTDKPRKLRAPPWGYTHPAEWEYRVQRGIREFRSDLQRGQYAWVGVNRDGEIGATFRYELSDGPSDVFVMYAAVSTTYRHMGGGVADELMRVLLDEITARGVAAGEHEVLVSGHIDPRNRASQAMARRNGMLHVGYMDEYQVWQRWLVMPSAEDFVT